MENVRTMFERRKEGRTSVFQHHLKYTTVLVILISSCSLPPSPQPSVTSTALEKQPSFPSPSPAPSASPVQPSPVPLALKPTIEPSPANVSPQVETVLTDKPGFKLQISHEHLSLPALENLDFSIHVTSQNPERPYETKLTAKIGQTVILKGAPQDIPLTITIWVPLLPQTNGNCTEIKTVFVNPITLRLDEQKSDILHLYLEEKREKYVFVDTGIIEKGSFSGKIFDDHGSPLHDVKVLAKSLNASVSFSAETMTTGNTYAFNNVPTGIRVEILATKPGLTPRRRIEIIKENHCKGRDGDFNLYDFGTDGSPGGTGSLANALSDKPEVIAVIPNHQAVGVDPKTSFRITFSEPMDKQTVEDTFTVRAFNSRKLTVDAASITNTFKGDGQIATLTNDLIWDRNAFQIAWTGDNRQVTFAFAPDNALPTDKTVSASQRLGYQVVFNHPTRGHTLKDLTGTVRDTHPFKLTDGLGEQSFHFEVAPDETQPDVVSLSLQSEESGSVNGDAIQVNFSELMSLSPLSRLIAGGMDGHSTTPGADLKAPAGYPGGVNATERTVAKNYLVTVTHNNNAIYTGSWFSLGGIARYGTPDMLRNSILLTLPQNNSGVDVNNLNIGTVASAAGSYLTGSSNGVAGEYTLALVKADGNIQPFPAVIKPADNRNTNDELATDLQSKFNQVASTLSSLAPPANAFTVTASAISNGSLKVTFVDNSGRYIGWEQTHLSPGDRGDRLPSFAGIGANYKNKGTLNVFAPGDQVLIQVAKTIMDPAGNTLDQTTATAQVK